MGDVVNAACDALRRKNYVAIPPKKFDTTEIKSFEHENPNFGDEGFISSFHEFERILNQAIDKPEDFGIDYFFNV